MFPKVKPRRNSIKWIIIIIAVGSILSIIGYKSEFTNSCTTRQLDIASDMKLYEENKNPELCDSLNEKISKFNDECKNTLEEVDCG